MYSENKSGCQYQFAALLPKHQSKIAPRQPVKTVSNKHAVVHI